MTETTDYLVFSLVAPMGSFGGLAGHERRGSALWPARSAILGLLGAALGIRRSDVKGQEQLRQWKVAVSSHSQTEHFQDFHTVQSVPSPNIKRPATRRAALAALKSSDNANLTRRDYRTDCAFGVAVWGGSGLDELKTALERPVFVPYLGRKSCPLSAPMAPQVITASSFSSALVQARFPDHMPVETMPLSVASDVSDGGNGRFETAWDDPIDRTGWHFAARKVYVSAQEGQP